MPLISTNYPLRLSPYTCLHFSWPLSLFSCKHITYHHPIPILFPLSTTPIRPICHSLFIPCKHVTICTSQTHRAHISHPLIPCFSLPVAILQIHSSHLCLATHGYAWSHHIHFVPIPVSCPHLLIHIHTHYIPFYHYILPLMQLIHTHAFITSLLSYPPHIYVSTSSL